MDTQRGKLAAVLNIIFNPKFKIQKGKIERFLQYIKEQENKSDNLTKLSPIYLKWLSTSLSKYRDCEPNIEEITFLIDVTCILSNNRQKLMVIHRFQIFDNIQLIVNKLQEKSDHSLDLPYLNLLDSLTETVFGREWLVTHFYFWSNFLEIQNEITCEAINNKLCDFMGHLLCRVVPSHKLLIIDIAQIFLRSLYEVNAIVTKEGCQKEKLPELQIKLSATLYAVSKMLFKLSDKLTSDSFPTWILQYNILVSFIPMLQKLLDSTDDEVFTFELCRILLPLHFLDLNPFVMKRKNVEHKSIKKYIKNVWNLICLNVNRGFVENTLEIGRLTLMYWKNISEFLAISSEQYSTNFEIEIMCIQMIPLLSIDVKLTGKNFGVTLEENEQRGQCFDSILSKIDIMCLPVYYKLKLAILNLPHISPIATIAFNNLKSMHTYMLKESAVIFFKLFVYLLEDLFIFCERTRESGITQERIEFFLALLDVTNIIINRFNLSWQDGYETMQILKNLIDFLQLPVLDVIKVESLKLISLTISKYLCPHMALLIDTDQDGTITYLGPLIKKNMQDKSREITSAALEVLHVISENAKEKYPYFQKTILEHNLHNEVLKLVENTTEAIVKKNALKCLQEFVKTPIIWREIDNLSTLEENLITILKTDLSVRPEAINVITAYLEEDYISEENLNKIYYSISHMNLFDPETEIKICGLNFWKQVIRKELQEQGMIDNEFPEVTFSKKLRKIVTLKGSEIKTRLNKVMQKLSKIGCLSVLIECLKSNEDEESKTALEIVNYLREILKKYGLTIDTIEDVDDVANNTNVQLNLEMNGEDTDDNFEKIIHPLFLDFIENDSSDKIYYKIITPKEFLTDISEKHVVKDTNLNNKDFDTFLNSIIDKSVEAIDLDDEECDSNSS